MTNRKKNVKIYKKNSKKAYFDKSKPSKLLRILLVAFQSMCGAAIGVCFFVYNMSSSYISIQNSYDITGQISFSDVSKDYYDSEIYKDNLEDSTKTILRYIAIREQMEEFGEYCGTKIIDVGAFANRYSGDVYEGPSVKYYLDDLIKWGQKASMGSYSFCTYEFYTAKEYCDFFNLDFKNFELPKGYKVSDAYSSFETLKNEYLTIDGKRAEQFSSDEIEYQEIIKNIQKSVTDIYQNYVEYQRYNEIFAEDKTNLRYYVSLTNKGKKEYFSNTKDTYKGISDHFLSEIFKNYGEYIYACPGKIEFNTNTPALYDVIKQSVIEDYGYSFPDDTRIYIGLDTSYPVKDNFYSTYCSFQRTAKLIPWLVSLGALGLVLFVGIFFYQYQRDKKFFGNKENKQYLDTFDKLPIEISFVFVILLMLLLYLGETELFHRQIISRDRSSARYFVPAISLLLLDLYIALQFFYGFLRRFICKNVWEGSIASAISPKLKKSTTGLRRWFWRVYDSAGVAIRTWLTYVLFLLFNCFWTCLMFFGTNKIIPFLVLFVFDASVGAALFNRNYERKKIVDGIRRISGGDYVFKIDNSKMHGDNKEFADAVNDIGLGLSKALEVSTKDEKLKADLITNVSHDIKTPLTSIINYVDLLKRENIEDEKIKKYISVLDEKSQRLKQLTFDLVEASKVSSGNISIDLIKLDFVEFIKQAVGEFEEKFEQKGLSLVVNVPSTQTFAMVDPRHMWRVLENILNNVFKYALENTRVYLDLVVVEEDKKTIVLSLKNISNQQLNIPAEELTERFIRGDVSRSTEGSGLGLSIAKNLTLAQHGDFKIYLDGDLFKVTITFDYCE